MSKNKTIAITASVAAAALPAVVDAADLRSGSVAPVAPAAAAEPFFVSIEGGAAFSDFAKGSEAAALAEHKLGRSTGTSIGPYGSISVGRKIGATDYDWRVSASATQFLSNKVEGNYGPYNGPELNAASFRTADVEVGRNFKTDIFEARVFAGMRGLNATATESMTESYYGVYGGNAHLSSRFLGVGPRVGADVRVGNQLGLVASVSAAALYGQQTQSSSYGYNVYNYNFTLASVSDQKYDWVTDVAASLAASWRPTESTEISAGYRAEKLLNLNTPQGKDLTSQGPFAKVGVKF